MYRFTGLDFLFVAFILLAGSVTIAAQVDKPAEKLQNVEQLVELLYTLEDFQVRFGNVLDNDLTFLSHADDSYFVSVLTEEARATAMNRYGESIGRAALSLTQPEVDSLIAVLQSPYGDVIRKVFVLDNSDVERELAQYVGAIVGDAVASLRIRDSLLFEKEYPFDLKEIMSGSYDDVIMEERIVEVERTLTSQKETLNGKVREFKIDWLNNGKYSLTDMPGNPQGLSPEIVINVYEIDGDEYKYIWKYPNGVYEKHSLIRTGFESYADEVKAFRWSLHDKYADASTSPLKALEIEGFKNDGGHQFYEVSDDYRVTARVERESDDTKTITLMTSSEKEKMYRVYGKAHFEIAGKQLSLDLYEPVRQVNSGEDRRLFLPFRDLTSGESSYGGGRYIDMDAPTGDEMVIDFNKSYNPYCAYTDGYSCPIPPKENTLGVAVEAGIKAPKH